MDEKTGGIFFLMNNQWVITIFGGLILTGLIKAIEMFLNRLKDNRDVKQANKEVVNFLAKVVINRTILKGNFLESIMHSIARDNNVPLKKMNYEVDMIEDTMIKLYEIDYLPMNEKNEMVDNLLKLKETIETKVKEQTLSTEVNKNNNKDVFDKSLNILNVMKEMLPLYFLMLLLLLTIMILLPDAYGMTLPSSFELEFMSLLLLIATTSVLILFVINSRRRRKTRRKLIETEKLLNEMFSTKNKKGSSL